MVKDPYNFWEKQRLFSFPGMSWHRCVPVLLPQLQSGQGAL